MRLLLEKIRKILRDRRARQMLTRIVSSLAAVVVFVTTYALVLPAITMESQAACGISAHQHDDSCYEEVLVCGLPESDGHTHTDACYTVVSELVCGLQEHQHADGCYDADGNLICGMTDHLHGDSCYEETRTLTCGLEEAERHHHDASCYEKQLKCGMEAHTHSAACYSHASGNGTSGGAGGAGSSAEDYAVVAATTEAADGAASGAGNTGKNTDGTTDATAEAGTDLSVPPAAEDAYVPELETLFFDQLLTKKTGIYYFHPEEGKTIPENSADITDWTRVADDTDLDPNDILRVYLRYTIPAGSLNSTNPVARYRLPANLHLTDQQMEEINTNVNGIANQYVNLDTLEILDPDQYNQYLGIEAVEGTRTPADDINEYFGKHPDMNGQEYINATVQAENVYDTEGLYGEKDAYLGQDLIFTFTPYTIQKNQNEYDSDGQPTKAGEKVQGWLCLDVKMDQVDWGEAVVTTETVEEEAQNTGADTGIDADAGADITVDADDTADKTSNINANVEEVTDPAPADKTTIEQKESAAEVIFAAEDKSLKIDEISTNLRMIERTELTSEDKDVDKDQDEDTALNAENGDDSDHTDASADEDMEDSDQASPDEKSREEGTDETDDAASVTDSATEINAETYPAASFEDSIVVHAGTLSTDNESAAKDTPEETTIAVSVTADAETFPRGTTMVLGTVDDMDTVASAVEGAVEGRTRGFHAVDISFLDPDGNEIEPLKPIKVSMTSEAIKQAVEDSSTVPVVVHVENPAASSAADSSAPADPTNADSTAANSVAKDSVEADAASHTDVDASAGNDLTGGSGAPSQTETTTSALTATVIESNETTSTDNAADKKETADTLSFDAGSFSVYAIVYTVDFHWEVNGKTYDFSIPGGGFVSLYNLVEALGIAVNDTETEKDEIQELVNGVESITFSSPELVSASKIEEDTTVGAIKDRLGLECEYSADLTEEQIAEINAQPVKAGDWALISVHPFTSEEYLTITMKNGDQFAIKVTDAQGDIYRIRWNLYKRMALIPAFPFPYFDEITESAQINFKYVDGYGRDISNRVNGSIDELVNEGQSISLNDSPFAISIDGYTLTGIRYREGRDYFEVDNIKAVKEAGSYSDTYNWELYKDGQLVHTVDANQNRYTDLEFVYTRDSLEPQGPGTIPLPVGLDPNELGPAIANKTLIPNLKNPDDPDSGDGTYTLTLSVTVPGKEYVFHNGANVVVVFDSSNSMSEYTNYIKDANGKYGSWDGKNFDELKITQEGIWPFNREVIRLFNPETNQDEEYDRQRYRPDTSSLTRMALAKNMVTELGNKLLAYNDKFGEGTVELAFVEFGTVIRNGSDDANRVTQDPGTFARWVRQCGVTDDWQGATNWDLALQTANRINFGDGDTDQTYIIFISDGNPTVRSREPYTGDGDRIRSNWGYVANVYGTGNSDMNHYNFNAGETSAEAIINDGKILFNLGVFGNANLMRNLINHGYYAAANQEEINSAFDEIIKTVTANLGYGDVKITDGITSMTSSTLHYGDASNFTYKVVDKDDHDITESALTDAQKNAEFTEVEKELSGGESYKEKTVVWDLGEEKLIDGATYSVSFIVWPDQDAYDLVSDLNNGKKQFEELSDMQKMQVVDNGGVYSLRTNTDAFVNYKPVKEVTDSNGNKSQVWGDERTINLDPPRPMNLCDGEITIKKEWDDSLDPTQLEKLLQEKPNYKAQLILERDVNGTEQDYITGIEIGAPQLVTTPVPREWSDLDEQGNPNYRHISTGLMISEGRASQSIKNHYPTTTYNGVTYYILETGHDYYFNEAPGSDFHFELEEKTWHPMVIDGELKNVTFKADNTVQTIDDIDTLTATNKLRSGLNIIKKVYDENNQVITTDDSTFYIKLTLKDKDGKEIHYSDYLRTNLGKSDYQFDQIISKKKIDGRYWLITATSGANTYTYYSMNEDGTGQIDQDEYPIWYNEYNEYTETPDGSNTRIDSVGPWIEDGIWESGEVKKIKQGQLLRLKNIPYGTQIVVTEVVPTRDEQGRITGYQDVAVNETADGYKLLGIDGNNVSADFNKSYNVIVKNQPQAIFFRKADIAYRTVTDEAKFKTLDDAEFEIYQGPAKLYINRSGKVLTQQEVELIIDNPVNEEGAASLLEGAGIKDRIKFCIAGEPCKLLIPKGDYKLKEVVSPDGYIMTTGAMTFTVGSDSNNKITVSEDSDYMDFRFVGNGEKPMVTVYNEPGAALPNTGGPGTTLLYILGIMLTAFAGAGLMMKSSRRKNVV